jgi:hypothetical protein
MPIPRTICVFFASLFSGIVVASETTDAPPPGAQSKQNESASALDERAERIVKQMQSAHEKLSQRDTGARTQELQNAVVAALDELLKTPPQKSPSPNPMGGSGQSGSSGGKSGQRQEQSSKSPDQSPQSATERASQRTSSADQRNRQTPADSVERTGPERAAEIAAARRRRLEVDVWGHLPEQLREQLLNTYGEKMVPQYEQMVRKFYEALSEPLDRTPLSPKIRNPKSEIRRKPEAPISKPAAKGAF